MGRPPLILDLAAEHVPATLLRQQRLAALVGEAAVDVDLDRGEVRFDGDGGGGGDRGDRGGDAGGAGGGGAAVTATAQLVGTTSDEARTFTWAWSAPQGSAPDELLTGVRALRDYGVEHEVAELTEAVWHVEDVDPFLLAAIARGWTQADAMLRVPLPTGAAYLLLGGLSLPPPEAHQVAQALTTGIAMAPMDHRRAAMGLFADNRLAVTGMDELLVASVGRAVVTVAFDGDRIADVRVDQT